MVSKYALVLAAIAFISSSDAAHPKLQGSLARNFRTSDDEPTDIMVSLKGGNTRALQQVESHAFKTREEKTLATVESLIMTAEEAQRNIFQLLNEPGVEAPRRSAESSKSFWITNQVLIKGARADLIEKLTQLDEVESIRPPITIQLEPVHVNPMPRTNNQTLEWGIEKIQAEQVWRSGNKGEGVIVANIDTGVRVSHETLKDNFVGDFGWFDPYDKTTVPTDGNGHGTHTMGTIAGQMGIGVAPGSKWMACRGCYLRSCSEEALLGCAEFMTCPTDPTGEERDCSKAPHVINNSWGGGQGDDWYAGVVNAWHEAGIIPVFANGNAGPSCGTANSPADLPNVIAVGATTDADAIAYFSSKGPSVTGLLKPEISAPGHRVRSAVHTGDAEYASLSGTSMATPHVAGLIALMKSADSTMTYDRVKEIVLSTPDTDTLQSSGMTCGDDTKDETFPNNVFGYGRINAVSAVEASATPAPTPAPVVTECKWTWKKFKCTPRAECRWSWRKFKCVERD